MFVFSKFLLFIHFFASQIFWFQNLKFSKLNEILSRGTLLYSYYDFSVCFFKIVLKIHIFWANLVPKSENLQIKGNPGIDSWVQPRLKLGFSWVVKSTWPGWSRRPGNTGWQGSRAFLPQFGGVRWGERGKAGFAWIFWIGCRGGKAIWAGFARAPGARFGTFLIFPNFLSPKTFFFFSCVGAEAPPAAKMPWGYISRKKGTIFCKSAKN